MLQETAPVRQRPGEALRRGFTDDYFELLVWDGEAGDITAFELSYDIGAQWRAVKWTRRDGCRHFRLAGDDGIAHKPEPAATLVPDDSISADAIRLLALRFQEAAGAIDLAVGRFVLRKLLDYALPRASW